MVDSQMAVRYDQTPGNCERCGCYFVGKPEKRFCSRKCVNAHMSTILLDVPTGKRHGSAGRETSDVVVDHFKWRHNLEYRASHAQDIADSLSPDSLPCAWTHSGDCCEDGPFDDRKIL